MEDKKESRFLGSLYGHCTGYAGAVFDSNEIAPTLTTMMGGNREPMILAIDEQNMNTRQDTFGTLTTDGNSPKHNNRVAEIVNVRQATKEGYASVRIGGSRPILSNKQDEKRESDRHGNDESNANNGEYP